MLMSMADARIATTIRVEFEAENVKRQGEIRNLGAHGLFVGTTSIPDEGEEVRLSFTPPGGEDIEVAGLVWWTTLGRTLRATQPVGFGLRLLDEDEAYLRLVERLLPQDRAAASAPRPRGRHLT